VNLDNWQKVASKILTNICKLKGAYWFQEPVDPVKYNIMDYFDIVTKPMDLGSIRKKISHNCYSDAQEFIADMNLIW
jgi:bromodomain-containing factor 1